jgi:hypothetical protein
MDQQNIVLLAQTEPDAPDNDNYYKAACPWYEDQMEKIKSEAYMTINYMKEIAKVLKEHDLEDKIPKWHEVKGRNEKTTSW